MATVLVHAAGMLVSHAASVGIAAANVASMGCILFRVVQRVTRGMVGSSDALPSLLIAEPAWLRDVWRAANMTTVLSGGILALVARRLVTWRPIVFVIGRVSFWQTILLWRCAAAVVARPYWSRVIPDLYVGSPPLPMDAARMAQQGISAVVSLCEEWPAEVGQRAAAVDHYLHLPTIDHIEPSLDDIHKGIAFIEAHIARGRGVLVHCKSGKVRSLRSLSLCALSLPLRRSLSLSFLV